MSLESEQVIVASIIRDERAYDQAAELLSPDDFTNDRLKLLFELIVKFKDAGRKVDMVILAAALARMQRWIMTGSDDPLHYLHELDYATRGFAAVSEYIRSIKAASTSRVLAQYCDDVYAISQNSEIGSDEMIAQTSSLLPSNENTNGVMSYRDAAAEAVEIFRRRAAGEMIGIPTGLPNLDKQILGFEPGTLTIIAARPSMGKSVAAQDFAHAAANLGPVYFFSLEMTPRNLAERAIASLGNNDFGDLRTGKIDHQMQERIDAAVKKMQSMPIVIDDRAGISVDQLCSRVRSMSRKEKPAAIIIDYLQLLSGKGNSENEAIGYISRSLKNLAKQMDVPVICLSQLNRSLEQRPDKRPIMADLRSSGSIEQDADVIVFLYRHEVYDPYTPRAGICEMIIRKNRNGEIGTIYTRFEGRYQRFREFIGEVPPETLPKTKAKNGMASFVGSDKVAVNDNEGF